MMSYIKHITFCFLLSFISSCFSKGNFVEDEIISTSTEEQIVSCRMFGYCFSCMPGFDGEMNCNMKLSNFCEGTKKVLMKIETKRGWYEKEPNVFIIKKFETKLKDLTKCKQN